VGLEGDKMTIYGAQEQHMKMPGLYKSLDESLDYTNKEREITDREIGKWNLLSKLESEEIIEL